MSPQAWFASNALLNFCCLASDWSSSFGFAWNAVGEFIMELSNMFVFIFVEFLPFPGL